MKIVSKVNFSFLILLSMPIVMKNQIKINGDSSDKDDNSSEKDFYL